MTAGGVLRRSAAAVLLFLSPSLSLAEKSVPRELLETVIGDTLKSRVPNPADPKLLAQLIYDIAMGKPERAVEEAFDSYKPESLAQDAAGTAKFEILKLIVPVVGVYAETAKQVYGVAERYVNDWQDWAVQNRMVEFKDEVLMKKSVPELDAAWNTYLNGDMGGFGVEDRMLGVLGANRAGIVAKMKEAYQARRKELERKEKLARVLQERAAARERAVKHLIWMKREAEQKISGTMDMLELLKMPTDAATVEKYLKDPRLHSELTSKWRNEVGRNRPAGTAKPTGDADTDKALTAIAQAERDAASNSVDQFKAPDYSPLLREYGLNADRLLTNNVSAAEYGRMKDLLAGSADGVNSACSAPYLKAMPFSSSDYQEGLRSKVQLCQEAHNKFRAGADEIDKRLNDYGAALVKDLSALTMKGAADTSLEQLYARLKAEFQQVPQAKDLEQYDFTMYSIEIDNNQAEDYEHWLKYSWEGKKNPDLKAMTGFRDKLAAIAAAYETLAPLAEAKAADFKNQSEDYERSYKKNLELYFDLYQKNSALADLFDVKAYDFKAQQRQFAFAQKQLGEPFMSETAIGEMRSRGGRARSLQEKWDAELGANRRFLAEFGGLAGDVKALAKWRGNGVSMDMTRANAEKYHADHLKSPLEFAACAIEALEETREGFPNRDKAVAGQCYAALETHQKALAALDIKVEAAKSMDFYAKRDEIARRIDKAEDALKSTLVRLPSAEVETALAEANAAFDGFTRFAPLSHENLRDVYDAYKKRLDRAVEIEDNLLHFACGSSSTGENRASLAKLPWKASPNVEKHCLDENRRDPPGPGGRPAAGPDPGAVAAMYRDFQRAYEGRSVSRVASFIDEEWAAQDGSTLSDLEEHLGRIFRIFDEVSFQISNQQIAQADDGTCTVSYDLSILSKIYAKNITREEKSRVTEKVGERNGRTKILKTENGSYWTIR